MTKITSQLAENPEPRCACIILTDVSGSMEGEPIRQLNAGLKDLRDSLVADSLARLRVELSLVSFDNIVRVEVEFSPPEKFEPPILNAGGGTMLGAGVIKSLELLKARMAEYRSAGVQCYRPWCVLLTDGKPSDDISEAARQVKQAEQARKLSFFPIGVLGADMAKLAELSLRQPLHLDGLQFAEFFEWLSCNLSSVAVSRPDDQTPLSPIDWSAP